MLSQKEAIHPCFQINISSDGVRIDGCASEAPLLLSQKDTEILGFDEYTKAEKKNN